LYDEHRTFDTVGVELSDEGQGMSDADTTQQNPDVPAPQHEAPAGDTPQRRRALRAAAAAEAGYILSVRAAE
jgi:hypothetical protein